MIEAPLEIGEVADGLLLADGAVGAGDRALDVAEHRVPLAEQLPPYLAHTGELEVLVEGTLDRSGFTLALGQNRSHEARIDTGIDQPVADRRECRRVSSFGACELSQAVPPRALSSNTFDLCSNKAHDIFSVLRPDALAVLPLGRSAGRSSVAARCTNSLHRRFVLPHVRPGRAGGIDAISSPSAGVNRMHALLSGIAASVCSAPYATYLHTAMAICAFVFLAMVIMGPVLTRVTG